MIWLDKKGGYRISHAEGATTYAEGGKRACTSSVLLHQKISLEKIPTESGSKRYIIWRRFKIFFNLLIINII